MNKKRKLDNQLKCIRMNCILMEIANCPPLFKELPPPLPFCVWPLTFLAVSAVCLSLCFCIGVGGCKCVEGGICEILFILIEMKFILCTFYSSCSQKRDAISIYYMDYSYICTKTTDTHTHAH